MVLTDVLADQDGLITRQQALDAGMTPEALRHAIRPGGPWQRLERGLYAAFTGRLSDRQRLLATVMRLGPEAMISGADACRAYGLRYLPTQSRPLVLVPDRVRRQASVHVAVRRLRRPPQARTVAGLPVAPVERAVADATLVDPVLHPMGLGLQDVRALVCESVQRRLTTPDRLRAVLSTVPRRGSRHLRTAVDDVTAGVWSAPECEFRDLVRTSHVLPEPRWNTPLPDLPHITPDGWWDEARLVSEVDSDEYHRFGLSPEQTRRRHSEMVAAGWTVMSVSPARIRRFPRSVLLEIESAYRLGLRRGATSSTW